MSPFLTPAGKWIFTTGVVMSLVGVLLKEMALVALGQIPLVVLLVSLGLLLPAGRAVDRRQVMLRPGGSGVETLRVEETHELDVWVVNGSSVALRVLRMEPVLLGGLGGAGESSTAFVVERREARCVGMGLRAQAMGRASLQGFDITIADRFGLVGLRDYLPCLKVLEIYPPATRSERRRVARKSPAKRVAPQQISNRRVRSGMDLRELRDYQPGDPLRNVAWKATVRQGRLITREFDDEESRVELLAVDISSSMRAGTPLGVKFEHTLWMVSEMASELLDEGMDVGLWSYDREVYGRVKVGRGRSHFRRIQRHLVGLPVVMEGSRTALEEEMLEAEVADYLLVQEHLDFRGGAGPQGELDRGLLRQWLHAVVHDEQEVLASAGEAADVVAPSVTAARRFLRLRGVPLLPPSETRQGAKIAGIQDLLRDVIRQGLDQARLTLFTDLAGVQDIEALKKPLAVAGRRGISVRVVAPFTPAFIMGPEGAEDAGRQALRDVFSVAEARDERDLAARLRGLGVTVAYVGPYGEEVDVEAESSASALRSSMALRKPRK